MPGSGPKLEISSLKPLGTLLHWLLLKAKSKQEPLKLASVQKNTLPSLSYTMQIVQSSVNVPIDNEDGRG